MKYIISIYILSLILYIIYLYFTLYYKSIEYFVLCTQSKLNKNNCKNLKKKIYNGCFKINGHYKKSCKYRFKIYDICLNSGIDKESCNTILGKYDECIQKKIHWKQCNRNIHNKIHHINNTRINNCKKLKNQNSKSCNHRFDLYKKCVQNGIKYNDCNTKLNEYDDCIIETKGKYKDCGKHTSNFIKCMYKGGNLNTCKSKVVSTSMCRNIGLSGKDCSRFKAIGKITKKGGTGKSDIGNNIVGVVKILLLSFKDTLRLIDSARKLPADIKKDPNIDKITGFPTIDNVFG